MNSLMLTAALSALVLVGCQKPPATMADWRRSLDQAVTIEATSEMPNSVARSRVCIAGEAGEECNELEMFHVPFEKVRTFIVPNSMEGHENPREAFLSPVIYLRDGQLPELQLLASFPDHPEILNANFMTKLKWDTGQLARIAIVVDGTLVYEDVGTRSGAGHRFIQSQKDLMALREVTPEATVAARIVVTYEKIDDSGGYAGLGKLMFDLSPERTRRFAAELSALIAAEAKLSASLAGVVVQ